MQSPILEQLRAVQQRITDACAAVQRPPNSVTLLAVSKTFGPDAIRAAWEAGQRCFGENYVQEALAKQAQLRDLPIAWHFIGPIQSNKTRDLALAFDWVHSIDRLKIAQRLSDQRPDSLPALNVCVQVNISGETSKSGCDPAHALALCQAIAALPRLRLRGLMAIPAPAASAADARAPFRALRVLWEEIRGAGLALDTLSAGMSDDLEAAIAEGATVVRVGSAIFGMRGRPGTQATSSAH